MSDEVRDEDEAIPESGFFLPQVRSFEDCNENFKTIAEAVTIVVNEIRSNAKHTQENMTAVVGEVNENMTKISAALNSILTSQIMMICLSVICLFLALVSAKSIIDMFLSIYHYGL